MYFDVNKYKAVQSDNNSNQTNTFAIWHIHVAKLIPQKVHKDKLLNLYTSYINSLQFGGIQRTDSGCIVCKTYIFIKNRTKEYVTQLSQYCLEQRCYICQKYSFFAKKADISKFKWFMVLKVIVSENRYVCILTYQILSSSIILTSFKQGLGEQFYF